MCGYVCVGFIDFMLKGKSLLDYTNLFSPKDHEKNGKIILKYFQQLKRVKCYTALFAVSLENFKNILPVRKNIIPFYYLQKVQERTWKNI